MASGEKIRVYVRVSVRMGARLRVGVSGSVRVRVRVSACATRFERVRVLVRVGGESERGLWEVSGERET